MKKILIVVTSHKELLNTDKISGLWIGEFTDPYYEFIDNGFEITIASPKGGKPPIDPLSELTENITASNRRFQDDVAAQTALNMTIPLCDINPQDYDALFYPGGHGPMFDLATDDTNAKLVLEFYKSRKPIASVCHGPAALVKAAEIEASILKGREVTGFSNAEERLVFHYDNIPFRLEDRLEELGADYSKALLPFGKNVEVDGLIITGQNPLSAKGTADELIKLLNNSLTKNENI
ncbi:type 1 glutamine amidotransferase domain-containing protein [Psychroserpens sp.]|uniref:type 1 glutamine amidotransferase domain-containing protein n=1 Tax=Psychroserpens sp. TaxID=2020870 RepID=UPI003C70C4B2